MSESPSSVREKISAIRSSDAVSAATLLRELGHEEALVLLTSITPCQARSILPELPESFREKILASASEETRRQWAPHKEYAPDTVGRLMETPIGIFSPEMTVAETTEHLRELVKRAFITYAFVVDEQDVLLGVITMRDLLFSDPGSELASIMLKNPFALRADTGLVDAMRESLNRHFPVYPVVDEEGRLLGLVRGQAMFEAQAIELSAQAGSMVGVEKEERISTPWVRSLFFRHPWLQLNLLTAFVAAFVVGIFEETIAQIVVLAVFLPVLAGQSGNTGSQALAVTLRGMTLNEIARGREKFLILKEALLGLVNGALVGLTAGLGMFVYAMMQGNTDALMLAVVVLIAMTVSCVISGAFGTLTPLVLKKLGADPATASSIFLTTFTDVASMGAFLGLATWMIL